MPKSPSENERLRKENAQLHTIIAELGKTVSQLQEQLKQATEGNAELRALLVEVQSKLDKLLQQKKKRDRNDFGPKTERHNPRPARTKSERSADTDKEKTGGIKHILDNASKLPHEPVQHTVKPEELICPGCEVDTVFVSNAITHQLEMVSASLKILAHSQETRACPKCRQYVVTADKPCAPIPGSYAGPRLLGEIIVGKLDDGLPNNRQQKILARNNVSIPRSTQCDWMQATANTLSLLYDLQKRELFRSAIIKTDDSSIKVQDRSQKGNIRKGKITAYVGDSKHKITMFDYSKKLSFDRNLEFLKDYQGIVQADAAGGFDALFEDGQRTEAGCSAHSRRRYFDAQSNDEDIRNTVLDIYRDLYKIEKDIKDQPKEFRLAVRRKKSKPLVKQLRTIISCARTKLNPSHELMKAINYTLNHWLALTRFLKNPDIAIDNNECERAIKCWVLVRKNSLFAGSDEGAKATVIHLSFIASAKRNGINPVDWYADVLSRINSLKTNELQQLLPQNWSPP
ncbi:MAG: IS66 family transposase [Candidatus Obscuribacterales bacterium]